MYNVDANICMNLLVNQNVPNINADLFCVLYCVNGNWHFVLPLLCFNALISHDKVDMIKDISCIFFRLETCVSITL